MGLGWSLAVTLISDNSGSQWQRQITHRKITPGFLHFTSNCSLNLNFRTSTLVQSPRLPLQTPCRQTLLPFYCYSTGRRTLNTNLLIFPSVRSVSSRIYPKNPLSTQGSFPHCSLEIFGAESCPSYRALSYTWGPSTERYNILVNNQKFYVRRNLNTFLQRACSLRSARGHYYWIDQICLDQANDKERIHQVEMMGDIYINASQVVTWLGEASDDSDYACNVINGEKSIWNEVKWSAETLLRQEPYRYKMLEV